MPRENEIAAGEQSQNNPSVPPGDLNIPGGKRPSPSGFNRITQSSLVSETTHSFSGPIPPPALLAEYDKVQQGFANRIIAMAETESEHRRSMERAIVQGGLANDSRQFREARRGQICAVIISVAALAAGCYTAQSGHDFTGVALGVSGVGGIVTTFILGRSTTRKQPEPQSQIPISKQAARRRRNQ